MLLGERIDSCSGAARGKMMDESRRVVGHLGDSNGSDNL
jgi:hypothetical protein